MARQWLGLYGCGRRKIASILAFGSRSPSAQIGVLSRRRRGTSGLTSSVRHNIESGVLGEAMRDDFQLAVKRTIALRVGYQCSNPTCGAKTAGPQMDPGKAINIGVASHITAASPGGPRYEPTLSDADRAAPENGIWLCQNCAKLVDNDVIRFPEALLRHWKQSAERRAFEQLGRQSPFDRTGAPTIGIPSASVRSSTAPVTRPLSADTIRQLCTLLPGDTRGSEQAKVLGSGRDAMGQQYAIVGAGRNHAWDWRVGLFTVGNIGWECVADIRLERQKAYIPVAIYVHGQPGALVVTQVDGWGTGVFRRSTRWYRIAQGEPPPLLSYPHDFYVVGWGMPFGRRLTSMTINMASELVDGVALEIRFDVNYTMEDGETYGDLESELFSLTETLSLEWNEGAAIFVPRGPSDDFARIEEIWTEGTEGFLKRNLERVRLLAQCGTLNQQSFITRHFSL